jgi:hypothetical protein
MGDRIVYTIKQADNNSVSLYSHWGGYDRYSALAYALEKSRNRWTDESYATRIIVSNLIGPDWDSETGWGLWAGDDSGAGDHPAITVYLDIKQVEDETGFHSFDEFISYHSVLDKSKDAVV